MLVAKCQVSDLGKWILEYGSGASKIRVNRRLAIVAQQRNSAVAARLILARCPLVGPALFERRLPPSGAAPSPRKRPQGGRSTLSSRFYQGRRRSEAPCASILLLAVERCHALGVVALAGR